MKREEILKRSVLAYSGVGVLLLIVLFVNGVSMGLFSRFSADLTQEGLYSLSKGSKSIVSAIDDPITLKFYFSKTEGAKFPSVKLYGNRIADLLREYQRASRGKIRLETYDPRPDSEDEEWAQKYGISAIPARTGESLYLGLAAVNALGEEATIPLFDFRRQEYLEYDITKLIYSLERAEKPNIAILSSLKVQGDGAPPMMRGRQDSSQPWFFTTQLAELGKVSYLAADTQTIAPEVNLLVVIHPKALSDQTLYAIDQFVLKGGNTLILEDPFCQSDQPAEDPTNPMAGMMAEHGSNLNKLTAKWGVEMEEKKVVADISLASRVDAGNGTIKTFPLWLSVRKDFLNKEDVTTSALEGLVFAWAGALKINAKQGVIVDSLVTSSDQSQLLDESAYRYNGGDPDEIMRRVLPDGKKIPIAVRIRGKLDTNFPTGKPGAADAAKADPTKNESSIGDNKDHLAHSKETSNVVVVSDVDFLSDRFSVTVQSLFGTKVASLLNDNQSFFANSAENLLGSDALISIRSRGQFSRPFTVVEEMEIEAQQKFQQQEQLFEARLNQANQRLSQLQSETAGESNQKQVLSSAVLDEIKKLRDDKRDAQQQLRAVRRNLRQGIEGLGTTLFLLNTFLVPLLLIVGIVVMQFRSKRGMK